MKHSLRKHLLFAALSAGNFFGCLATDENPDRPIQDCEGIDISAAPACELRDMVRWTAVHPVQDPMTVSILPISPTHRAQTEPPRQPADPVTFPARFLLCHLKKHA